MEHQLKKQEKLNKRLNEDHGLDARTHARIEQILRGRIAMGDGKMKKKKKVKGGAKSKNAYIIFLKKHSGKGWTRKQLLAEYRKQMKTKKVKKSKGGVKAKTKTKTKTKAKGGARSKNPYISFLKKHRGKGYSKEELQAMYRAQR